jgi:hypothetical protein
LPILAAIIGFAAYKIGDFLNKKRQDRRASHYREIDPTAEPRENQDKNEIKMPGIRVHRQTLFKLPDPESRKKLIAGYEKLARDQQKVRLCTCFPPQYAGLTVQMG